MANAIPEELRILRLEQEVVRLRQSIADLEARLRKPTLQEHLQNFLKDDPSLDIVEQHRLAATLSFLLRKKLGPEFSNPDPEDVYIVTSIGHCLCITYRGDIVIRGKPQLSRENSVWGLRGVAEAQI